MDQERQYLLEAIKKDLALVKKIEDRLRCEDNPRCQERLRIDGEEIWQHIRERKAHLSSLEQEELKRTVSHLGFPQLKLDPLPLPKPLNLARNYSLDSWHKTPAPKKSIIQIPARKPRADYNKLRYFLEVGQWKEADLETSKIIIEVAKRQDYGWLRAKDIKKFSKSDVRIIDTLWRRFSQDRFGFSVQRDIWLNLDGESSGFDGNCLLDFGNYVGWYVNDNWLKYETLSFNLDAPIGHLPSLQLTGLRNEPDWLSLWKSHFKGFLSLIENCVSDDEKNLKSQVRYP